MISGGSVELTAERDLGVLGSTVVADGTLKLKADRDIDIVSTQNSSEQSNESHRSQSGLFGKIGRPTLSTMSFNQDAQGKNVEQVGSMVGSLGGNVSIEAGGLKGATISAPTVGGLIGGDLTITSLQDISTYASKQSGANIGVSVCIPPFCAGISSVTGGLSRSTVDAVGQRPSASASRPTWPSGLT